MKSVQQQVSDSSYVLRRVPLLLSARRKTLNSKARQVLEESKKLEEIHRLFRRNVPAKRIKLKLNSVHVAATASTTNSPVTQQKLPPEPSNKFPVPQSKRKIPQASSTAIKFQDNNWSENSVYNHVLESEYWKNCAESARGLPKLLKLGPSPGQGTRILHAEDLFTRAPEDFS